MAVFLCMGCHLTGQVMIPRSQNGKIHHIKVKYHITLTTIAMNCTGPLHFVMWNKP